MDVLEKIQIQKFYLRDIDGIFKLLPLTKFDVFFSSFLNSSEKIDFIFGRLPKKIFDTIDFVGATSWLTLEYKRTFLGLNVFANPKKTDVPELKLKEKIYKNTIFAFLTPETSRVVLIRENIAFGDCEILDFLL